MPEVAYATNPLPSQSYEEIPLPPIGDEVWKYILDRNKTSEMLAHRLRGETWVTTEDGEGNKRGKWECIGEKLINDMGVKFFMTVIISSMTPDKIASFITDEETSRMARDMRDDIIDIMTVRGEEFEINPANMSVIVDLLDHYYFANLTASRNGTILEALKPTVKHVESYNPQENRGMMSRFPTFG